MPPSSHDYFYSNNSNLIHSNSIHKSNYNMVLQAFDNYATNNLSGIRVNSGGLSVLSEIMTPYAGDYPSSLPSSYYMDNDALFTYNQGNWNC